MKVFLTGITGLVGSSFVVALLKERKDVEFVCLTRKSPVKSAYDRVYDIVKEQCEFDGTPEVFEEIMRHVQVVDGDVTTIEPEKLAADPIIQGVDVIFHCAADVNLGKDLTGKTFRINFHGSENMIQVAKLLKVKAFHYVSTAYVAGGTKGRAMEAPSKAETFNNPYEESKCKAENMVRNAGIPFSIYRPGIICGRLNDGKVRKPLAFYRIVEFLGKLKSHHCAKAGVDPREEFDLKLHFNAIPSERIYFVPIDYVQLAITKLFQKPVCNMTYHVTGDSPVNVDMIDDALCNVLKLKHMDVYKKEGELAKDAKLMEKMIGDLFPYFTNNVIFDQTNVRAALGDKALDWQYDIPKLEAMMREYFYRFQSHVPWLMEMLSKQAR